MIRTRSLTQMQRAVIRCARCPELRGYCAEVARVKRRAFANETYWGRPVPGFGDPAARIVIVGLAPAAHGGNRTGRVFTGDRSGDFLFAALHRAGLANQPIATDRNDGLELRDVYITAAARCAPPANRPTPAQLQNCLPHLVDELALLGPRVVIALGSIGWNAALAALTQINPHCEMPRLRPRFGHGGEATIGATTLLGSYHVSQQNTFTGRLTPAMLDDILNRARSYAQQRTRTPQRDESR